MTYSLTRNPRCSCYMDYTLSARLVWHRSAPNVLALLSHRLVLPKHAGHIETIGVVSVGTVTHASSAPLAQHITQHHAVRGYKYRLFLGIHY